MAKECKLCTFGDGVCTQGFRKQHERTDPNCRLHGVTDRGNSRPRQSSEAASSGQPPQPEGDAANASRPLAELTQFRTRQGNLMLFAPQPMDTWIGKEVLEDQSAGGYRDVATGKPLSRKLAASYMAFCKRHTRRCRMGDVVDKYIHLVDKCQPKVFAEARIYVARFPEEAGDLFKQIKKVRKQIRKTRGGRRQTRQTTPSSSGEAAALETGSDAPQGRGTDRGKAQGEEPTAMTRPGHVTKEDADTVSERREGMSADTPPDWRDSSNDDAAPTYEWPCGDAGRPSDRGDSPSHLAVRPKGEPKAKGRLQLVPNEHWRGVQLVQAHMAKARTERALAQDDASRSQTVEAYPLGDSSLCKFCFDNLVCQLLLEKTVAVSEGDRCEDLTA